MRVKMEAESGVFSKTLGRGFCPRSELERLINTGAPEAEVRERFLDFCFLEGVRMSRARHILRLRFDYGLVGVESGTTPDTCLSSTGRPLAACYELRRFAEWVPSPRLRARIEKLLGDQARFIHELEARGDLRKARWQVACTWVLMISMIFAGPVAAIMRLIQRRRA